MHRYKIQHILHFLFLLTLIVMFNSCGSSGGSGDTPGAEATNANLSSLLISNGTLTFNTDTIAYSVEVDNSVSSMTVTAETNQSAATMRINGTSTISGASFGPIQLNVGQNTLQIVVTSSNGSVTKTYSIVVTRLAPILSNNANLSNISLSAGTLSPGFSENMTAYNVQVPYSVPSMMLTPVIAGVNASIKINNTAVASGSASSPVVLNTGSNTISVLVTAEDGTTTKAYTISVNRLPEPSHNANLANLTLTQGTLAPAFNENTTAYTVQVQYNIPTMTLTPTVVDSSSSITVNGMVVDSGSPSQAVTLSSGDNSITIIVTAQDGMTTKTYSVVVTKLIEPSHNANLANLTLSSGSLAPVFDSDTTSYTAQVPYNIASITVTPTSAGVNSIIRVDDVVVISGTTSAPINLNIGNNTISVQVTAEDGATIKNYSIIVVVQSIIIQHNGSIDPTTEGFSAASCCGPSTVSPINNDLGESAWSIKGDDISSQVLYFSGPFTSSQKQTILNNGFVLSTKIRVIGGATYTPSKPFVTAQSQIDLGSIRFDMAWSIDSNGDTVVVLPDSFGFESGLLIAYGQSYTLTGSGSSYHLFELVYNPYTQSATLFIDGVVRLSGFGGSSQYLDDSGVRWGTGRADYGQANFSKIQFSILE